ncbi:hypothetical protein BKA91DRAFT_159358 [Yarrowia lipolytica]|uniref:Uncharacterized protein n=1 Tax=Yarrowia lipolytica TaxID=4952 RepID=A0A371C7N1_YARLL|nr:hypothetical protein BKA91DRAFT_159358 [Yarrowia lipolytica]KAE8170421.1 hypothetical protein BKA90DRAFT_164144 [Yarrowia lipolytica]RDW26305.1 hypothetical protein B0I71DRAFT_174440 [Yarrowia lipolytica]
MLVDRVEKLRGHSGKLVFALSHCTNQSSYKLVKGDLAEIRKKPGCLTFTLEGRDANSDRGNVGDSYKSLGKIDIAAIRSSSAPTPFKKPPIIIGGDDGD